MLLIFFPLAKDLKLYCMSFAFFSLLFVATSSVGVSAEKMNKSIYQIFGTNLSRTCGVDRPERERPYTASMESIRTLHTPSIHHQLDQLTAVHKENIHIKHNRKDGVQQYIRLSRRVEEISSSIFLVSTKRPLSIEPTIY